MATRGQTHNKRAREMALREKRERKQLKKDQRAAGLLPYYDDDGQLVTPADTGIETDVETDGEVSADEIQAETAEAVQ